MSILYSPAAAPSVTNIDANFGTEVRDALRSKVSWVQPRHRFVRAGQGNRDRAMAMSPCSSRWRRTTRRFRRRSRMKPKTCSAQSPRRAEAKVLIDIHAPPAGAGAPASARQKFRESNMSIAIASGKGGVGKSTVAANLAVALAENRSRGRPLRLRHLRSEHFAHVRLARTSDGDGRKPHHADRAIRFEADVDGIPARRQLRRRFCADRW